MMSDLQYLDRQIKQREKELKRLKSPWRKLWRNTVVHLWNLAFFRLWPTWAKNAYFWFRRGGGPEMCLTPDCGHQATSFGQCSYHHAARKEYYRDAGYAV